MQDYTKYGQIMAVGDIGRFNCIYQHMIYPGERITPKLTGVINLSGLKQRTTVKLHVRLEAFAAPIRWYWPEWVDYIKDGLTTTEVIPTMTGTWTTDQFATQTLGLGYITRPFCKWFAQHPVNVWNEWYRWPEDAKEDVSNPPISFYENYGKVCQNLPSPMTRIHEAITMDTSEYQVPSATTFDVRELAQIRARFDQAAKTDWSSMDRYMQFMQDVYGAKGSVEVDKVPIRLRNGAELSVLPRDLYATDAAGLGEIMSINKMNVSHHWEDFIAPEHMIVCYILLLRFSPISDSQPAYGIYPDDTPYFVYQGDPNIIANEPPVDVKSREVENGDGTVIGKLPAGWQMRNLHNHVSTKIGDQNNFPLLDNQVLTAAGLRDASKISNCFRSLALREYQTDLTLKLRSRSLVPSAGTSIMAGGTRHGSAPKGHFGDGGYLI